ncbi:hypothetical protein [Lactobacillus terrae]|uniref:hypothetical protein n=1 Tax=Lactobacillus terrae TaxID=2269374 RepID=UPI001475D0FD|nr:hypothetical protein [Lactobacillus terrae]
MIANDYEIIKHSEKSVWVENTDKNLAKDLGLSPDFVCSSNSIDVAKAIVLIYEERLN